MSSLVVKTTTQEVGACVTEYSSLSVRRYKSCWARLLQGMALCVQGEEGEY